MHDKLRWYSANFNMSSRNQMNRTKRYLFIMIQIINIIYKASEMIRKKIHITHLIILRTTHI